MAILPSLTLCTYPQDALVRPTLSPKDSLCLQSILLSNHNSETRKAKTSATFHVRSPSKSSWSTTLSQYALSSLWDDGFKLVPLRPVILGLGPKCLNWVVVKELTLLCWANTIIYSLYIYMCRYTHYDNLI